jgi:hypothetical protein
VKILKEDDKTKKSNVEEGVIRGSWQMWHRNGTRCPKGTVPIRRSTAHDVLRSKSLFDFGKKQAPISLARRKDAPDVVSANGHEVSYLFPPLKQIALILIFFLVTIHNYLNLLCSSTYKGNIFTT